MNPQESKLSTGKIHEYMKRFDHHDDETHVGSSQSSHSSAFNVVKKDVEYTCPIHLQVRQVRAGNCSICGMTLELVFATTDTGDSPELRDMTRRLLFALALTVPLFALEMGGHLVDIHHLIGLQTSNWIQLLFGTPVAL